MSGRKAKLSVPSRFTINCIGDIHANGLALLEGQNDVLFDVDRVKTLDTAALQVLVALRTALQEDGRNVIWSAPSPEFMRAVELSGLQCALGIAGS
ncbi:MAG: STAS domain-containing protein [Pseudomonadota bacterium]